MIETGGAGAGRHVIDLARALSSEGHRLSIVYSARQAEPWFVSAVAGLKDVRSYCQPMHHQPRPSDIHAVRRIRKIVLRDGPFDIIHGHSSKGGAIARFAAMRTSCKTLYTPHAFVTMNATLPVAKRYCYGVIERLLATVTDALICVSSAEYDHAISLGIAPRRLRTIPNGLFPLPDVDRSMVRSELGLHEEHAVIGFVGRLESQKAVDRLIAAFAIVAKAQPSARLVIVGHGSTEQVLRQQAANLGISNRIVWTGSVNGARMMAAFDVFALSSIYEAFPYVFIEAALCGLPIVSTDVGGTTELVHTGKNGSVIAIGDVPRFAAALNALISDPTMRSQFGAASRELGKNFTARVMADRTLELYKELVSAH